VIWISTKLDADHGNECILTNLYVLLKRDNEQLQCY